MVPQLLPDAIGVPAAVGDVLRYAVKELSTVSAPERVSALAIETVRATASKQRIAHFMIFLLPFIGRLRYRTWTTTGYHLTSVDFNNRISAGLCPVQHESPHDRRLEAHPSRQDHIASLAFFMHVDDHKENNRFNNL